jgi:hypothetical protein
MPSGPTKISLFSAVRERFRLKYVWWLCLATYGVLSFFGVPLPKDWNTTVSWLLTIDEWTLRHAAYPGLFLFFIALVIGTVIAPELLRLVKSQIYKTSSRGEGLGHELLADAIQREANERRRESDPVVQAFRQHQRVGVGLEINPHALQFEVGESGKFFSTKSHSLYQTKRTFNLRIENSDKRFKVSGCRVQIAKIEPQTEYSGPWLLRGGMILAAGEDDFIPLVTYGEADKRERAFARRYLHGYSCVGPSTSTEAICQRRAHHDNKGNIVRNVAE